MAGSDSTRVRDPLEEGEDKASNIRTSGNREESMTESGKDVFGADSAVRNPDSTEASEGSGDEGRQDPADSGTTSLGGESSSSADRTGPGGIEGKE